MAFERAMVKRMNKTNIETCFRLAFNMRDVPTVCTCDAEVLECECLDLNDEIAEHYKLSEWSYIDIDAPTDDRCWAWGAVEDLERFANDIDAGTVWEPPKDQIHYSHAYDPAAMPTMHYLNYDAGAADALYKEINAYSGINNIVRGEPKKGLGDIYFPEVMERHRNTLAAAQQEIVPDGVRSWTQLGAKAEVAHLTAAQQTYGTATNKGLYVHNGQVVVTSHDWHHDGNNWACLVCGSKFDPMTPTCSGINAADWAVPVWETEPAPVAKAWKWGHCEGCACELSPAMDGDGATRCTRCSR